MNDWGKMESGRSCACAAWLSDSHSLLRQEVRVERADELGLFQVETLEVQSKLLCDRGIAAAKEGCGPPK